MTDIVENLDAEELYHLGIKASEKGDHQSAIIMLKKSLAQKTDAKTQYILAAEHAEIGMFDRAVEEMEKAIELDKTLWTAHLQLGLLKIILNRPEDAISSWQELLQLNENDSLYLFGSGMISLVENRLEQAVSHIEKGLSVNTSNPTLNKEMQSILDNIKNEESLDKVSSQSKNESKQTGNAARSIFLASYNKENEPEH